MTHRVRSRDKGVDSRLDRQPNKPGLPEVSNSLESLARPPALSPDGLSPANLITLQQTIGNRAVQRMLARPTETPHRSIRNVIQRSTPGSAPSISAAPGPMIQRTIWTWNGENWTPDDKGEVNQELKPDKPGDFPGQEYDDVEKEFGPKPSSLQPETKKKGFRNLGLKIEIPSSISNFTPFQFDQGGSTGLTINVPSRHSNTPDPHKVKILAAHSPISDILRGLVITMALFSEDDKSVDARVLERLENVEATGCFENIEHVKIQEREVMSEGGSVDDYHQVGVSILDKGIAGKCVYKQVYTHFNNIGLGETVIPNSGYTITHTVEVVEAEEDKKQIKLTTHKVGAATTIGKWQTEAGEGDKESEDLHTLK